MANRDSTDDRGFGREDRDRQRNAGSDARGAGSQASHPSRSSQSSHDSVSRSGGTSGSASANASSNTSNAASNAASGSSRRSNRGFASMDSNKQREIASKGGRAAHAKGTAHEFDSGEAREAGRKGGVAVSRNREHMAMIGRKGGEARGAKNAAARQAQGATQHQNAQGATQNSGAMRGDREVQLPGSTQNTGASGAAIGGERRPNNAEQRENRPESH